jgi:hypothetical protein
MQELAMELCRKKGPGTLMLAVLAFAVAFGCAYKADAAPPTPTAQAAAQNGASRSVGTVKSISGKTVTLTTDAGAEVTVQLQDDTKLMRIAPGEKSLKNAAPLQLQDLQVGDRVLAGGMLAPDGKSMIATSLVAIKQADIATMQLHEREEWQRHGVGGLVTKLDAASGVITISTNATGAAKDVTVQVSKQTVLRRYAPDSVKFDDAKPAPIDQIKAGDQLRARGTRSADGTTLTADEVVSGTFRNIAGTIVSVDPGAGTLTVTDLVAKKPVTVKVSTDTQLRKLQPQVAQMIAMRLRGATPDAAGAAATPASARPADGGSPSQGAGPPNGQGQGSGAAGAGRQGFGGAAGGAGGARSGDFQQMLSRMPAVTLADLQKGDAVLIVTTEGTDTTAATAITLLAGVEPILQASPKDGASSILTPWSMSGAPSGDSTP